MKATYARIDKIPRQGIKNHPEKTTSCQDAPVASTTSRQTRRKQAFINGNL